MSRAAVAPSCLVFAFACTSPSPGDEEIGDDSTDGTEESSTDSTDGTDSTDDETTDTGADPVATITGVILDTQGATLPSAGIQLCGPIDDQGVVEACIPAPVDTDSGEFSVGAYKLGLYALKCVHGPVDGRFFTGQSFQITLAEGDALDFSVPPITIPETSDVTDVTAVMGMIDISIDDILTLRLDPSLAQSPDFTAPNEVGGLQVPEEFWRITEVDGAPVIAAWAFTPFGTHATEGPFEFTLDTSFGLAAGELVNIYGLQKDNGVIHDVATGTVNVDATGIDLVPTVDGLQELSWLLVTQ